MTTPLLWVTELLDAVGSQPVGRNPRQCPAHDDSHESLSLSVGKKGQLLLKCHAGCEWRKVLGALHLSGSAAYRPPSMVPAAFARQFCTDLSFPKLEASNGDGGGLSAYVHESFHRYGDRTLERRRHPVTGAKRLIWWTAVDDGEGIYLQPGLKGKGLHELPLYNETDVRAAVVMGEPVLLVESESSVDALTLASFYATTWAGSAAHIPVQALQRVLGGYERLVHIPDLDDSGAGIKCAVDLKNSGLAPHIVCGRIGEDARDLLKRVGADELRAMVRAVMS